MDKISYDNLEKTFTTVGQCSRMVASFKSVCTMKGESSIYKTNN